MKSLSLLCLHSLGYLIFSACYSLLALHLDSAFRLRTSSALGISELGKANGALESRSPLLSLPWSTPGPCLSSSSWSWWQETWPGGFSVEEWEINSTCFGGGQAWIWTPVLWPTSCVVLSGFYLSNLLLLCQMEVITQLFSRAFCLDAYLFEHLLCARHSEVLYVLSL